MTKRILVSTAAVLALWSLPAPALEMDRTLTIPSKATSGDEVAKKADKKRGTHEVVDEDEARKKDKAYEFLSKLEGIDSAHGIEGLRRLGKVLKEDVQQIQNRFDPTKTDEIRNIQYKGMSISVYLTQIAGRLRMLITHVVITSPKWPVKYGLTVGTPRKKVEEILGKDAQFANPPRRDQWYYGDGGGTVTFTFDNLAKVKSIEWDYDLD